MSSEQAPLSLLRHATSKLQAFVDLEELGSYGFRGEALPSIASVSRLTIHTRNESSDSGVSLSVEGTLEPKTAPIGRPVGTTISVRDLFFNVPARRKFLKSSNTESGHVGEVVIDAALSCFDVSFTLTRDGRKQKNFPRVRSRRGRVEQFLGDEELTHCKGERGPLNVEAFFCQPERARRGTSGLKVLVNGRPVRDRSLAGTIAHAFGGALERGRYPRGVVYLDLPGRLVDVNVHPQKTEVRFASARAVMDALHSVVSRQMRSAGGRSTTPVKEEAKRHRHPLADETSNRDRKRGAWSGGSGQPRVLRDGPSPVSGQRYSKPLVSPEQSGASASTSSPLHRRTVSPVRASIASVQESRPVIDASTESSLEPDERTTWRGLRYVGQAGEGYLVCTSKEGLFILDQHAAHERVLLSELLRSAAFGQVPAQVLLFPAVMAVSPDESGWLNELADEMRVFGLDVRVRSDRSASLHSVPKLLNRSAPEQVLREVLDERNRTKESLADVMAAAFRNLACTEAITGAAKPTMQEAGALLRGLKAADVDLVCHHNRVLLDMLSFKELARKKGSS